jgi:shikimate kinase
MHMIYLLIGTIGTGKSSVGKALAKDLGYRFIELDAAVLEHTGCKSADVVSPILWKESQLEVCRDLATDDNLVIACGGSIVENDLNLLYFNFYKDSQVLIVRLTADEDELVKRVLARNAGYQEQSLRTKLEDLNHRRKGMLEYWAEFTVDTTGQEAQEIATKIKKHKPE